MKSNITYLISLTALAGLCALLAFWPNAKSTTVNPNIFKVPDQTKIDRVVFVSPTDTVALAYSEQGWKVNGRHKADRNLITALFATVYQAIAKREVAASLSDSVARRVVAEGTRVSLFEQGELRKTFWVHGHAPTNETWFQLADGKPYLMNIPGYRVYVASVFQLGEDVWRDKLVFDINWQNFRSCESAFAAAPEQNFRIQWVGRALEVPGLPMADTAKVANYLDAISELVAERFVSNLMPPWDSLSRTQPLNRTVLTDVAGRQHTLELFPPLPDQRSWLARNAQGEYLLIGFPDVRPLLVRKQDLARGR
ncbi:MAG: hypothetical protein MUC38_09130 [Cyclobacteriaceae bacterium]|nr:hypothetical protein [Cyclobacteriaceae bacterium]